MIDQIRTYGCAAIILILLTVTVISKTELAYVKNDFKTYKDNINDQVQKAKINKAKIDAEHKAETKLAGDTADREFRRLAVIIDGLRNNKGVPGGSSVFMAGGGGSTMPGSDSDTEVLNIPLQTYEGTCSLDFYADAMTDNIARDELLDLLLKIGVKFE